MPRSGIYVLANGYSSSGQAVFGFHARNRYNKPPICVVSNVPVASAVGVDQTGNLVVGVNGAAPEILLFSGPRMCGPLDGSFADPYGQPGDIATRNAVQGKIAVANVFDGTKSHHSPGSISVCTLAKGCTANLTNLNMNEVFGVAMDGRGNCWASSLNTSAHATLTYFKKCAGSGQTATGYTNPYPGGLDLDSEGNLVSMSFHNGAVYVYHGCRPTCATVAGPLALRGPTTFAHLNQRSTEFVAADFYNFRIDVYTYTPTRLTFEYDFSGGLSSDHSIDGVAVNPPSRR